MLIFIHIYKSIKQHVFIYSVFISNWKFPFLTETNMTQQLNWFLYFMLYNVTHTVLVYLV
jgi:hypothetical protein